MCAHEVQESGDKKKWRMAGETKKQEILDPHHPPKQEKRVKTGGSRVSIKEELRQRRRTTFGAVLEERQRESYRRLGSLSLKLYMTGKRMQ